MTHLDRGDEARQPDGVDLCTLHACAASFPDTLRFLERDIQLGFPDASQAVRQLPCRPTRGIPLFGVSIIYDFPMWDILRRHLGEFLKQYNR